MSDRKTENEIVHIYKTFITLTPGRKSLCVKSDCVRKKVKKWKKVKKEREREKER